VAKAGLIRPGRGEKKRWETKQEPADPERTARCATASPAPYRDVDEGDSSVARGVELRMRSFRYRTPRGYALRLVHRVYGCSVRSVGRPVLMGKVQGASSGAWTIW
jgi:hypothetical protein